MSESIAERVEAILKDCLYREDEIDGAPPEDAVIAEGVMAKYAFHPQRLESHKAEIAALCNELPDEFQKSKGGGWSFLNLCQTKAGVQWGEHRNCEQLVVLAVATKQGSYPMPRDMWSMLPGSMPYVQFDTAA
jgi:hypothetical protein